MKKPDWTHKTIEVNLLRHLHPNLTITVTVTIVKEMEANEGEEKQGEASSGNVILLEDQQFFTGSVKIVESQFNYPTLYHEMTHLALDIACLLDYSIKQLSGGKHAEIIPWLTQTMVAAILDKKIYEPGEGQIR